MLELTKKELREIYSKKREALTESDVELFSKSIFENLKSYLDWGNIQNVHLFLPIRKKKEVDTKYLVNFLWKNDKKVFVPKVSGDDLLCQELFPNDILRENKWNILELVKENFVEQKEFDIIITPLLYCDGYGNRVGYGKGFYDRFFVGINPNTIKIGVNFFSPKEKIIDVFEKDVALDYLVTPSEVFSFTSKSIK